MPDVFSSRRNSADVYRQYMDIRQSIGAMVVVIVFSSFSQMEVAACCILGLTVSADCGFIYMSRNLRAA